MRKIDIEQRRARLVARHHLLRTAASVEEAAGDLVGLHSSDPATVYLEAWARIPGISTFDVEDALYERRNVVRMLGMRRTMFVVPPDLAAVMDAACTQALAPPERRRLIKMLEEQGIADDGAAWIDSVGAAVLHSLERRGEATAVELTEDVPELAEKLTFGEGKTWGGQVGVSTRILFLLATHGDIVRARPRGSWISSQYRWAPTERWLGAPLPEIDVSLARVELVRRWLGTYGPATETDVKWWTGWSLRDTRKALGPMDVAAVDLSGEAGIALADDVEDVELPPASVALLPSLDSTVMGWKVRDWYLGGHQADLYDRNGNAGPTVWVDGGIVGGWAQLVDGSVTFEFLEKVGSEAEGMVEAEAAQLAAWLGDTRIKPRFPTPLEKRLTGR